MLYMRRTSKLEELLEGLCALFICTVWLGRETLEMKGTTCPHSLGRLDNVYSINGQNSESMNGKKGERDGESERGSGAGSGVSVWQDLLLISEPFIHRLVINSPLNTSFSSPLRPASSSGDTLRLGESTDPARDFLLVPRVQEEIESSKRWREGSVFALHNSRK